MNRKYILIAVVLVVLIAGGVLAWQYLAKIQIISPNGGEQWKTGETYTILWDPPSNVQKVDIQITDYSFSSEISAIIIENLPNMGSYSWTIPNILDLSPDWKYGDNFKIRILEKIKTPKKEGRIYGIQGESDSYFAILASETTPPTAKNWPPSLMFYTPDVSRATAQGLPLSIDVEYKWVMKIEDPDSVSFAYEIDWGDGTKLQQGNLSTSTKGEETTNTFFHKYSQSGNYEIVVKVTDEEGARSEHQLGPLIVD
jgi:hypothetical protein